MASPLLGWRGLLGTALLGTALVVCYADVLRILGGQWIASDIYSHGPLIPFVSAYLVWARRDRLPPPAPSWLLGGLTLACGLALLAFGRAVAIVAFQQLSFLVTLAGLVLFVLGRRALRVLWLPVAYLLLMMPFWEILTNRLHYPFQQLSARLGSAMLGLLGVPVHREATYLQLPNVTLEVASVCSGVNYLIAVIALGIPLAYISFKDQYRRVGLVAFGTTVAILANSLRVALIGAWVYYGPGGNLHGPGHVFQGIFVAVVGYAALFVGVWLLGKLPVGSPADAALEHGPMKKAPAAPVPQPGYRQVFASVLVAALVLVAARGGSAGAEPPQLGSALPAPPVQVPASLGLWTGADERFAIGPFGPDAIDRGGLWRVYTDPAGHRVQVYVGAFTSRPPSGPLPAYWTDALDTGTREVFLKTSNGDAVQASSAVVGRAPEGDPSTVIFWFQLGRRTSADRTVAKLAGAWHRLTGLGAAPLVVVLTPAPPQAFGRGDGLEAAAGLATELAEWLRGYGQD